MRAVLQLRFGAQVRVIGWSDLLYLFVVRALRVDLTPKARAEFYEALSRAQPDCADEVRFGRFHVAVADLVDELKQRTTELDELRGKVEFADNGNAVLASRGVEVHRIAALLNGGLSVNAVLEEYPFLSEDAVEVARTYAQTWPRPGRPYPRTTSNRAMRDTAEEEEPPFEVLQDEDDE